MTGSCCSSSLLTTSRSTHAALFQNSGCVSSLLRVNLPSGTSYMGVYMACLAWHVCCAQSASIWRKHDPARGLLHDDISKKFCLQNTPLSVELRKMYNWKSLLSEGMLAEGKSNMGDTRRLERVVAKLLLGVPHTAMSVMWRCSKQASIHVLASVLHDLLGADLGNTGALSVLSFSASKPLSDC